MKREIERIRAAERVVIYGAGVMAKALYICIKDCAKVECFIVSDRMCRKEDIDGIAVLDIREGREYRKNSLVLVAVIDKYRKEISDLLEKEGFENALFVTFESRLWECIREEYVKEEFAKSKRGYRRIEDILGLLPEEKSTEIRIYQVRSHLDKKTISADGYGWEIPIQAGAALTSQHVAELRDNSGDNISHKNREYCELTALYWIWKNDRSKWKGICHYRRHFELEEKMIKRLENSGIDVILTIPILNFPDVRSMYCHDHIERDWNVMLEAIDRLDPQYSETTEQFQQGQFYHGYNMLIAREEIFNRYCAWLFPILEYCERHSKRKRDPYQGRYLGFLAERLLSIFFLHHWEEYKIVHCPKMYLEAEEIGA